MGKQTILRHLAGPPLDADFHYHLVRFAMRADQDGSTRFTSRKNSEPVSFDCHTSTSDTLKRAAMTAGRLLRML